jgi:hypothetical protein
LRHGQSRSNTELAGGIGGGRDDASRLGATPDHEGAPAQGGIEALLDGAEESVEIEVQYGPLAHPVDMTPFPATIRAFRCGELEVRICNRCKTSSPDAVLTCPQCHADLTQESEAAVALARLRANPRVMHVRLILHEEACPACRAVEGDYAKGMVPAVPLPGCSHPQGCRCFYEPVLSEIYP